MTAGEARHRLEPLIGTDLGPGDWMELSLDRIEKFHRAVAGGDRGIPVLLLAALIPGLTASIDLPIDRPRTALNYGLDRCRLVTAAAAGERLRARATLLGVEERAGWLQVNRLVVVENEAGEHLLEAETLTRMLW